MGAMRQLLLQGIEAALPRERFVVRGPADSRAVALTFDDGPHPEVTPRLLDTLAQHQVRATFFVIGREAERHPALVRRIVDEGHAIGHHSWSHSDPAATSSRSLLGEVRQCQALLLALTGVRSDQFRPPKGQLTLAKLSTLLRARQQIVLWSNDPKDYALTESASLVHWARATSLPGGTIALLHDTHPWCLDAIAPLSERAQRAGIRFVTLEDWFPGTG